MRTQTLIHCPKTMTLTSPKALLDVSRPSSVGRQQFGKYPFATKLKGFLQVPRTSNPRRLGYCPFPSIRETCYVRKRREVCVFSPDLSPPIMTVGFLDALNDEYGGVLVNAETLPTSPNVFASSLRASLAHWKSKGKRGIWLKILLHQSHLIPIAIQEGFDYHHAETGYVMLTYWIPDDLCMLPASPSHQIGVAGFVMNNNKEVLVVKEKCPCSCSGVWKMPTGYINKSEDIFSGVVREVKEETDIDSVFVNMVAFRHVHLVAFEKSDLMFICVLEPLSSKITIDHKEIEDANWMHVDEFMAQTFYEDDEMSKKAIELCVATCEDSYRGFRADQLSSKIDGKLSHLYYDSNLGL